MIPMTRPAIAPSSDSQQSSLLEAQQVFDVRSRRGACAGETRSEGALYGQGFFLPEVGGLFSAVRSKTLKKKTWALARWLAGRVAHIYLPMEAPAHAA